jgi:hypothetical protein
MNKIIKTLKHVFIPHEHNDYKPHFFRELSVSIIIVSAIVLFCVSAGTKLYINKTDMTAAVLPAVLVDLTNNARQTSGQLALARSTTLDKVAQLKAQDMATYGYFAHTSPQGITPWYWFSQAGYSFIYAGENLAIDFSESVDVENAWLNSPTHKANIMSGNFTEIGIATKEGYYNGHPTTYVVQMFGKPMFKTNSVVPTTTSTKLAEQIKKQEPTKTVAVATNPVANVKGETAVLGEGLETIKDTKEFVSVKNTAIPETNVSENNIVTNNEVPKYSTWFERFVFLTPTYVNNIYRIIVAITLIALILMVVIEVKRQHPKNIIYGICVIVIIFCFIYINKEVLALNFLL